MLNDAGTYTTLPVTELERAQRFYSETLGMREVMVTDGGIMFASGATQFLVYPSSFRASGHTQMSWTVPDIRKEVAELRGRGLKFEEFDVPGVKTVDGISQVGPNVWTAYFKDPDGNLLGLTQIGERTPEAS